MKQNIITFLVGGAVRDMLLGLPVKDRDYVVVGSTPEQMLELGYKKVGADFPVFLHPETGEEYALARREKKVGKGYLGFESEFTPDVTLEQDLVRRDLTVNSIAFDESTGEFFDPFGGIQDLQHKILRHTSSAFEEDPVRVLRVARFMARFGSDFFVAKETKDLMSMMAKKGVLFELQPDRVYKELSRALLEETPRLFFDTLLVADCLKPIFPELYRLKSSLEAYRYHPEGDSFEHTMLVLTQAAKVKASPEYMLTLRYAALVHDIGKGLTKVEDMPKHYGHDVNGVPLVQTFSDRLNVPSKIRDVAKLLTRYHMMGHQLTTVRPITVVRMFETMRAFHNSDIVKYLYDMFVSDSRGRLGSEEIDVTHLFKLFDMYEKAASVKFADVFPNGETDVNKIKTKIESERAKKLRAD